MNKMLDVLNVSTWTDKNGKEQKSFIRSGKSQRKVKTGEKFFY